MPTTLGLLYAGDMGATFAGACSRAGLRVVTTVDGRSAATAARAAALEVLPSVAHVVAISDCVISIVSPWAAREVAESVVRAATKRPAPLRFVEANAITRAEARALATTVEAADVRFIDAGILGSARDGASLALYASGPEVDATLALFEPALRTRSLGPRVGDASAFKQAYSVLLKGVAALFFQVGAVAAEDGFLDELMQAYDGQPGLGAFLRSVVPTYPAHAKRRGIELETAAEAMEAEGWSAELVAAAGKVLGAIAHTSLDALAAGPASERTLAATIHALVEARVLRR